MPKQEDRLSALPDSILCDILSFLPTNEAVQTVLIRRFGTLWSSLPILDFDDELLIHLWPPDEELNTGFFWFVQNVLKLHQRPTVDRFRVNISTMLYGDITYLQSENLGDEIDSWLNFALRKQVKFLEFGFGMVEPGNKLYELPFVEFVSASMVEMKLVYIEMKLQKRVQMGSLRVLKLEYVSLNDDVFKEVIRGCPLLKELEISNCLDSWDFTEISAPMLDMLTLNREMIVDSEEIMRINCPKLSSFNYSGCVDGLEIANLSSLAEFVFHLRLSITTTEFKEFTQFHSILTKLLHAESVSLSCAFVAVLFYSMLNHLPGILIGWKRVELEIWLTEKHIPGHCHLLKNSPYLEKLVLMSETTGTQILLRSDAIVSELGICSADKEVYSWSTLKTVVIHNISMGLYPAVVSLVKVLLKSSPVLNELVIYYKAYHKTETSDCLMTSEQLTEFSKQLPTFTKASPTAKVLLL